MSIQSNINQMIGTLGIASSLYQQTPIYQTLQKRAELKRTGIDIVNQERHLKRTIKEHKAAFAARPEAERSDETNKASYEAKLKTYQDELFDLERRRGDIHTQLGDLEVGAGLRANVAGMEARRRLYAQRAAESASQLRTEQRDVVNKRIADLEAGMNALSEQYDLASEYGRQQEERAEGYRSKILEVKDLINKGGNK